MKRCNKSHECPYGNAFEKGLCAYRENMNEYDLCPSLLERWDEIIDEYECKELKYEYYEHIANFDEVE